MADSRKSWESGEFWITAHNNYLDIAVLEWCKLFADRKGKHYWGKSVTDPAAFTSGLLVHLRSEETAFVDYCNSLKAYRDKFVAHLDEENDIKIPRMTIAKLSTQYLFEWLRHTEDNSNAYHDAPRRASEFYLLSLAHARKALRGEA